jgi:hypothetical protein
MQPHLEEMRPSFDPLFQGRKMQTVWRTVVFPVGEHVAIPTLLSLTLQGDRGPWVITFLCLGVFLEHLP